MGTNCHSVTGMTIATAFGRELNVTDAAKRCSVLFVNPGAPPTPYRSALEALGFLVTESDGWPDDDRTALDHQVIVRSTSAHPRRRHARRPTTRETPLRPPRPDCARRWVDDDARTRRRVRQRLRRRSDGHLQRPSTRSIRPEASPPATRVPNASFHQTVAVRPLNIADCRLQIDDWN